MGSRAFLAVLHLCAGNVYGGIERIVSECAISRSLCPRMAPSFAVCFAGRLSEEIEAAGAPCVRIGAARMSRPHTVLRARRELQRALSESKPDAVICHSSWIAGLAAPVARRAGLPVATWIHDRLTGRPWAERWARLTPPDLLIVNSRYTDETVATVYPGVPHEVVYAPVPAAVGNEAARGEIRAALDADPSMPVVLIVSRFERWKGHRELITALSGIEDPWRLWIAGRPQRSDEAEYERELRSLVEQTGISGRTRFLGERRDVPALMRAADVHCQPNPIAEPFGLTYVEALYAGLPVVTTGVGGALEIVTDACGLLVPAGDTGALRDALRRLIRDPGLRARLGAAGPVRAAALCDPARQLALLADVMNRTIAPRGVA
jgi:glycosyltransferase involved in cell wall biosynthesis